MRIELNKKSLFALASDTRLEILKSLNPKRRTISQLSEKLGIDKAAIHRHLKKLAEGELVKRYEDHGFVYYGLSWKARDLMSPKENTKIIILMSCSWLLMFGAVFFLVLGQIDLGAGNTGDGTDFIEENNQELYSDGERDQTASDLGEIMPWRIPAIFLVIGSIGILIIALRILRKPKQKPDSDE